MNFAGLPRLKLQCFVCTANRMFPCAAVPCVVPYLESAINRDDRAFTAAHALSDISDNEVRFRQKMNDLANFGFSQTPTFSSHEIPSSGSTPFSVIKLVEWWPATGKVWA